MKRAFRITACNWRWEMKSESRLLGKDDGISPSGRVVDPSEAISGLSFLFGAFGVIAGVAAVIIISPGATITLTGFYCLLGAFAGGSAGVVTGGMVGAVFAVARGVNPNKPKALER